MSEKLGHLPVVKKKEQVPSTDKEKKRPLSKREELERYISGTFPGGTVKYTVRGWELEYKGIVFPAVGSHEKAALVARYTGRLIQLIENKGDESMEKGKFSPKMHKDPLRNDDEHYVTFKDGLGSAIRGTEYLSIDTFAKMFGGYSKEGMEQYCNILNSILRKKHSDNLIARANSKHQQQMAMK